jgi:hypothetical protein
MSPATENVLTLAVTGATVVIAFALGAGGWSLLALLFLGNMNVRTQPQRGRPWQHRGRP